MKFGLSNAHWQTIEILLLKPLQSHGAQVWIFGSRARGNERQFSDLDVLYSLPEGHSLPTGLLSQINEDLEESNLPIKVDLVAEKNLAESYKPGILKDRVLL